MESLESMTWEQRFYVAVDALNAMEKRMLAAESMANDVLRFGVRYVYSKEVMRQIRRELIASKRDILNARKRDDGGRIVKVNSV